ncbi:MAG: hypothetical protein ACRC2S_16300 [Waterburya sp.]
MIVFSGAKAIASWKTYRVCSESQSIPYSIKKIKAMTTFNINAQLEQEQRIQNDFIAVGTEIEKLTNLYYQGSTDASLDVDPVHPENQNYWEGYQEQLRRQWIAKKAESRKQTAEGKEKQGYLYAGATAIAKKFGKLKPIGSDLDYQGWKIELEGLEIEIATYDWEEAHLEIKWIVYATHPDALKFLAREFGEETVRNARVDDVFGSAA